MNELEHLSVGSAARQRSSGSARAVARIHAQTDADLALVERSGVIAAGRVRALDYVASAGRQAIAEAVNQEEMLLNIVGREDPMVRGRLASLMYPITATQAVGTMSIISRFA